MRLADREGHPQIPLVFPVNDGSWLELNHHRLLTLALSDQVSTFVIVSKPNREVTAVSQNRAELALTIGWFGLCNLGACQFHHHTPCDLGDTPTQND